MPSTARTGTWTWNEAPLKRASKLTASLPSFKAEGGRKADVEDDLPVLDILPGHHHPLRGRIHDDMGRFSRVADPLVKCTQQIGSARLQWRISRSTGLKQARNVERAKIEFMYLTIGWAWDGNSMP